MNLALALRVACTIAILIATMIAAHRNSSRRRASLYGDARFATDHELKEAGLFEPEGILIGKRGRRHLFFPGQQFVLVAAPTRSGKGVGIVIPNLLTYPGSVVVLDIKGENFERTAGFRQRHGQEVFRFSPFSGTGARFNPLQSLSSDPKRRFGEVMAIAGSIYPLPRDNPFWNEQAANLFVGLVLYLCERTDQPRTLSHLIKVLDLTGVQDARKAVLKLISTEGLSDACTGALRRFASVSDATAAGILSAFYAPLLVFADPMVADTTSTSDFELAEVRERPISIYVCVEPQHLKAARVVLNLFFTQLIYQNTQSLPDAKASPVQCLLLLDEFPSIGRIDILAHSIAFIAGYNLRLVTIVQSIAQLLGTYGEHDARNLIANHAMRVVFAPNELRDAREISETLGVNTLYAIQESHSKSRMSSRRSITERRVEQARPLMLPQELRTLPPDQQLLLLHGSAPILAEKLRYYEDPVLKARADVDLA